MSDTNSLVLGAPTLCSLSVHVRRITGQLVGRPLEMSAIQQEMDSARSGLAAMTVEGEPGIGKTRLLLAAAEVAAATDVTAIAVTADEEIRGPFLLARSILGSEEAMAAAAGTPAEQPLRRAVQAISGHDDPSLESLPADQKLLRAFDLASIAMRELAAIRPVALLIDDLQWADEDSIRMLRYIVRTATTSRLFMMFAVRPEETAFVNEAVTLLADMERMGVIRRTRVGRFNQVESSDFLHRVLGSAIDPPSASTMHAQAEGVPYILEELAHAYRDTGMIQKIDGTWRLARNAERLVPSNVRTLINRRASRLPDGARQVLGEAALLGRTFSLRDLRAVKEKLGDTDGLADSLAEALVPAVTTGLLLEHPPGSAADYSFSHEQVREAAASALSGARQRSIHAAIVDLLTDGGDPPAASLPMIAHHALAAGQPERCARFSVDAARAALTARAPEEVLRVVDIALPIASSALDRISLLRLRDDALEMLRSPGERLDGLAELAALSEALADPKLEMDISLRRSGALRDSGEHDRAVELSRRVRERAAEIGNSAMELAACLELGQALLHAPIGESYGPTASEVDLESARESYERALALAEAADDDAMVAAASRELGVIAIARVRAWVVEQFKAGTHLPMMQMVADGAKILDMLPDLPIGADAQEAGDQLQRALTIFERLGDRRGAMSAIIAMAYISWGPDIHMGGSAKRIEEIRRLSQNNFELSRGSTKAAGEAQMLFGVHVYARAKVFPDLAITRGEEAYEAARLINDRQIEFSAAGGVALCFLELGDVAMAAKWIDKAAAVAVAMPSPLRTRQLEMWRGMICATSGDIGGMQEHLQRSIELATAQGRTAARCEALARLALCAAPLAVEKLDTDLSELAERSAEDCKALIPMLPGHPVWGAQADAALAQIYAARGDEEAALGVARSAIATLNAAMHEDVELEIVIPTSAVILKSGTEEEKEPVRAHLHLTLTFLAQHFVDETIRVKWFQSSTGRGLTAIAGPIAAMHAGTADGLPEEDLQLLTLLAEGQTNAEMAEALGIDSGQIDSRLTALYAAMGAASRAEATTFALLGKMI